MTKKENKTFYKKVVDKLMENGRALALGYRKALDVKVEGNVAEAMKAFLAAHHDEYAAEVLKNVGAHLKSI